MSINSSMKEDAGQCSYRNRCIHPATDWYSIGTAKSISVGPVTNLENKFVDPTPAVSFQIVILRGVLLVHTPETGLLHTECQH